MSMLKLKGSFKEYEISEQQAVRIKEIFEGSYPNDHIVSIGDLSFRKRDIAIIQMESIVDHDFSAKIAKDMKEYDEKKIEFLKLNPEEKAKRTIPHYQVFHFACMGTAECDTKPYVELATKFYQENPQRRYVDLRLMNTLIETDGNMSIFQKNALAILENAEIRDRIDLNYAEKQTEKALDFAY